jgi:sulfur relay (sulfurtransferase) DsrC/TusE family protein
MNSLTVGARTIELDKDGFLVDLSDWSADVASALAAAEDIELTPSTGKFSNCCAVSTPNSSCRRPPVR